MTSNRQSKACHRGSVIVVVLITLMLASLMLVKFMETSEVELVLATRSADRDRLKDDAYAALETALSVMAEVSEIDDGKLHVPEQGWIDPYSYAGEGPRAGVDVAFTFQDESGRISLPRLNFDDMLLLAQALGLDDHDARKFSDGLYTWMKSSHVPQDIEAEASRYERSALPHKPPLRSLRSWDELRAVALAKDYVYDENGALTPFGVALHENVSLYRFTNSNINAITPGWLAMHKWDEFQTSTLTNYKSGKGSRPAGAPPWFRDNEDVSKLIGTKVDLTGLDSETKLLRIIISLKEGAATLRLNALVAVDPKVALPNSTPAEGPSSDTEAVGDAAASAAKPATPSSSTTVATSSGASVAATEEKLKYPYKILELSFDSAPPPLPVAPADSDPSS